MQPDDGPGTDPDALTRDQHGHPARPAARVVASVIMPALDAEAFIATQLAALAAQKCHHPWEVLIVDNGSTDATPAIVRRFLDRLPRARLIECERRGSSAARNAGAREAEGELLLFVDADDQVADGWLQAMIDALGTSDAVGGRIENDLLNPGRAANAPRHPDHLPVPFGFLPRAITANLGVHREAFDAIGGFNDEYDYGSPDTEFCWRLQLAGYRLGYDQAATVHYRHRDRNRDIWSKSFKTGRSFARLYRDFGGRGMPQGTVPGALVRWGSIVVRAPVALVSRSRRARWVESAGLAAGKLAGSREFGVRYW